MDRQPAPVPEPAEAAASASALNPSRTHRSVFRALLDARHEFGGGEIILVDGDERALKYDEIVRASFALGHALKRGTARGEAVGIMLPSSAGAVIAFFALSAYGRVPAMLNFTSGVANLKSALATAKIKRIVTAHRFIELAKLEQLVSELSHSAEIVYLEDVRNQLSTFDKVAAVLGPRMPFLYRKHVSPESTAVILFTSGTEGAPKGVVLSHVNLLANVEQVRLHIELFPTDVLFNPLPTFHCFGLTAGALMPLFLGIKAVLHPTPLQPHDIVRRIRELRATILLTTDTFITQYARAGHEGDLKTLRLAVCGAERLRDETRQLLRRKYHIELLEGYGVTEASPVVAANQIGANRLGTVGHLMPGMEYRLEPVEGIPYGGRLFIRGPNVMLGYLKPEAPGQIQPPPEGWYDTGDVASIDPEGFISIRGRVKRFAKIGGETVSLAVVENCASALWPDFAHAAVTLPDPRKGEQIVLVTTAPDAGRGDFIGWAHRHGVPELAVPRRILHVQSIPVLGTGKTDYMSVQKLAAEDVASEAAG